MKFSKLILCIFFNFLLISAFSQSESDFVEIDSQISAVDFVGLKKTKESYLRPKFEKYIGAKVSETNLHEIETALQAEGIFEEINVDFVQNENGSANLQIELKEKITFIPLPFAMYSSSGFMGGLMVMDTNAFGVKDTFVVGGFASKKSATGIVIFSKPPRSDGSLGFSVNGSFSKSAPEFRNTSDEVLLEYKSIGGSGGFSVSRKLSEKQTVRLGISLGGDSSDEKDEFPTKLAESFFAGTISAGYSISSVNWNGFFLSTSSAGISGELSARFWTDSDSAKRFFRAAKFSASFQKPFFFDRLRIVGQASGVWGADEPISKWNGGGAVKTTLLPGNFKTERILGASAGFEIALVKFKFGLFSAYANFETVFADDFSEKKDDFEFCFGPSFGTRLYLSKIAFPALAFGLTRNISKEYWQFAFSAGISF